MIMSEAFDGPGHRIQTSVEVVGNIMMVWLDT